MLNNTTIFDENRRYLLSIQKYYGQENERYLTDYTSYIRALHNWQALNPWKTKEILERIEKNPKVNKIDFANRTEQKYLPFMDGLRGLVYILVKNGNILYIGSTSTTYERKYSKLYRTACFQAYMRRFGMPDTLYIQQSPRYKELSTMLVNTLAAMRIPTCNIVCENESQLLNYKYFVQGHKNVTYQEFLEFRKTGKIPSRFLDAQYLKIANA